MIKQNFDYALQEASTQYTKEHINQRILLENELYHANADMDDITQDNLLKAAETISQLRGLALYDQTLNKIYSSLMVEDANTIKKLIKNADVNWNYISNNYNDESIITTHFRNNMIHAYHDKKMLSILTPLSLNDEQLYMVNTYDITYVFNERQRQYTNFFYINIFILAIAAVSVTLFSRFITSPLKKLTFASESIANGAYSQRINISSRDEIGMVAKSFDKMAEAVETKISELQRVIKSKDDFVSNFTHELKTPMTSILGYADMLRSHENEPEIQIKAAEYIYKEIKRLEALSLKLMDLMSLSGEYIQIEPVATTKLLNNFKKTDIEKTTVLADKILIQCVLRNLWQNAENAGADEIKITGKIVGDKYRIFVRDDGSGIPQKELDRIVEPFYMVDKSRSREKGGSGLGLALCERILNLHGTALTIESTAGIGTMISFNLEICR